MPVNIYNVPVTAVLGIVFTLLLLAYSIYGLTISAL
jgi:hypothetical protein